MLIEALRNYALNRKSDLHAPDEISAVQSHAREIDLGFTCHFEREIRLCSKNRRDAAHNHVSLTPGKPGGGRRTPRTKRFIFTPAWEAKYRVCYLFIARAIHLAEMERPAIFGVVHFT